jgi:hypothetical protein
MPLVTETEIHRYNQKNMAPLIVLSQVTDKSLCIPEIPVSDACQETVIQAQSS